MTIYNVRSKRAISGQSESEGKVTSQYASNGVTAFAKSVLVKAVRVRTKGLMSRRLAEIQNLKSTPPEQRNSIRFQIIIDIDSNYKSKTKSLVTLIGGYIPIRIITDLNLSYQ